MNEAEHNSFLKMGHPLVSNISLGVAVLSYAGQFAITIVADRGTYPELDVFAAGMRNELQALAGGVSPAGSNR